MKNDDLTKIEEQLQKIDPSIPAKSLHKAVKVLSVKKPKWPDAQGSKERNGAVLNQALAKKRSGIAVFYRYFAPFTAAAAALLVVVTGGLYWLSKPNNTKPQWSKESVPVLKDFYATQEKPEDRLNGLIDEKDMDTGTVQQNKFEYSKSNEMAAVPEERPEERNKEKADLYFLDDRILVLPSVTEDKKMLETISPNDMDQSSKTMLKEEAVQSRNDQYDLLLQSEAQGFDSEYTLFSVLESGDVPQAGTQTVRDTLDLVLADLVRENSVVLMPAFSFKSILVVFRGSESEVDGEGVSHLEKKNNKTEFVPLLLPEEWKITGNTCQFIGETNGSWDILEVRGAEESDLTGIKGNMVALSSSVQKMQLAAVAPLWMELKSGSSEAALTEWALMIAGYLPKNKDVYQKITNQLNTDPRVLPKTQSIVLMSSYLFK